MGMAMASQVLTDNPSNPATDNSSLTPCPYSSQVDFEETIEAAAERIAKWRGLKLQWYILTVGGVILIVLTIIYIFTSTISSKPLPFLNATQLAWAWLIALTWCGLYFHAMRRLKDRIIEDKLCLRCGEPLKVIEIDEEGEGLCPGCNTVFNINEFHSPSQKINTLRAVKQRVHDQLASVIKLPNTPPSTKPVKIVIPIGGLYRNRSQFDRTMKRAADRLLLSESVNVRIIFTLIGAIIPASAYILFAFTLSTGWYILLVAGLPLVGLALLATYLIQRVARIARFINNKLCLSCGYPLHGLITSGNGCGRCPECGRKYHLQEYTTPPRDTDNPDWQLARRVIFGRSTIMNDDLELPGESFSYVEFAAYPPAPPETDRASQQCQFCGYSLVGTPKSDAGIGVCSECGKPFNHSLKPIPQIKSY